MKSVFQEVIDEGNEILEKGIGHLRRRHPTHTPANEFKAVFKYIDKLWVASCNELNITLEEGSFDALVVRMKVAVQDVAEVELGYTNNIKLVITVQDRIEEIKIA
ncbi:MAG: DUF1902 domain-containing protein [Defluviitaleaceae bacterium]|nr:DUF1902 domain-containing protein [Defluviitaleaceae bacterium]MCL2239367.1 DUF1902 domain-containing protein [Defluviitaleaceae bacterium]